MVSTLLKKKHTFYFELKEFLFINLVFRIGTEIVFDLK